MLLVRVFEYRAELDPENIPNKKYIREEIGVGVFHAFGTDYCETENGVGNYSTAIVEMSEGLIKNVPVEDVQFISSTNESLIKDQIKRDVS